MRLLVSQCVFFDAKGRGIISRQRQRDTERERERERERKRDSMCVCGCIVRRYMLPGFVYIIVCKFAQRIVAAGVIEIIERGCPLNF